MNGATNRLADGQPRILALFNFREVDLGCHTRELKGQLTREARARKSCTEEAVHDQHYRNLD